MTIDLTTIEFRIDERCCKHQPLRMIIRADGIDEQGRRRPHLGHLTFTEDNTFERVEDMNPNPAFTLTPHNARAFAGILNALFEREYTPNHMPGYPRIQLPPDCPECLAAYEKHQAALTGESL